MRAVTVPSVTRAREVDDPMSDRPWLPEFPVDAERARALVATARPELLAHAPVRIGQGWDNDVWRFGDWAFRFPRRQMGVELIETEARALPAIAARLPVPIPAPEIVGGPTDDYPARFVGHRFLVGETADRQPPDPARRRALAPPLAAFLRALHDIPRAEAAAIGVPEDRFRGDLRRRLRAARARLDALASTRWASYVTAASDAIDEAMSDRDVMMPSSPDSWVVSHGDLYPRHLLLDARGRLSGVIDWGDLCRAEPAVDLAIVYSVLPSAAHGAFWAIYGDVAPSTRARARLNALHYGVALAVYASDVGDDPLLAEAGRIFARLFGALEVRDG